MAEGNEAYRSGRDYPGDVVASPVEMINVSGIDTEPLWVNAWEVAAIGARGKEDSLIVLKSGTQLVAKSIHPNELVGLVVGVDADHEG